MKKEEVPQDDDNILEGKTKLIEYAVDEEGNYVKIPSVGWEPKNIALKQAWNIIDEKINAVKEEVRAGRKSPIAYFMEKNLMDAGLLAMHTGYFKCTIKRHCKLRVFKKLSKAVLEKYAYVFNIAIEDLIHFK